ncbi:MAG TPA: hypothetical protein IAC75_01115 [Candidatus Spyradosoma merdigallinarum]|uniref:Uncharacterized protein n=1 Tax=Candidatus Spyradosoma merdigallinarum TaxID=2840950 RepID=A0A9D1NID2_9BACT|nr:hypothetical protein [Candidatus Spyradosoma merdigallinarum]
MLNPVVKKHIMNIALGGLLVVTLLYFVFQLVSANATRDRTSDNIARIEKECVRLTESIRGLQATKDRLCNAELLRHNPCLPAELKEIPNENIRRVDMMSAPRGSGRLAAPPVPKALAIELSEMALLPRN